MSPPRVLTIAGSDSGGGAGIQADIKTFLSLGTYGLSVITALTAQNTKGVSAIHASPAEFVLQQFNAVSSDIEIDAVKIGMLCNEEIIKALAPRMNEWKQQQGPHGGQDVAVVLDPVMVSTSGSLLLSEGAIETLVTSLLPLCTILTPNLPEARQLLRHTSEGSSKFGADDEVGIAEMMQAAEQLSNLGPEAVLVKGGHAQLTRGDVDRFQEMTPGFVAIKPLAKRARVYSTHYPNRPVKGVKRPNAEHMNDARSLAGLMGAAVSCTEHITFIRTDFLSGASVLRYPESAEYRDEEPVMCDVLYQRHPDKQSRGQYTVFVKPMINSGATHGTGCTLSSALAASLAQGHSLLLSTSVAIDYVQKAISGGIEDLGTGHGPLDHSFPFQPRGLTSLRYDRDGNPHAHQTFPLCRSLISNSLPVWNAFVLHPFVRGLADGDLDKKSFIWFMKQDYIFLGHYARVWAQAATSLSNTFEDVANFAAMSQAMVTEANLHLQLCQDSFGISRDELEYGTPESAATLAYTRFVMETGRSGDVLDLLVAVAPCMLGYAEIGLWLQDRTSDQPVSDPDYQAWIDAYSADDFQQANQKAMLLIEARAQRDPPSQIRMNALQKIWDAACRLEKGMWDEAMLTASQTLILEP